RFRRNSVNSGDSQTNCSRRCRDVSSTSIKYRGESLIGILGSVIFHLSLHPTREAAEMDRADYQSTERQKERNNPSRPDFSFDLAVAPLFPPLPHVKSSHSLFA